ncbi:MAG: bifunctional methylenetetrahydrofolate dehydrogenase/methenyltetrahydrofolate cyclohydrolase FolD [Bdellovibrionaceae bacterium]|nr:bifunctional methylenetetrahydrofolate dehydrogenase/methenyltetrahydrofolate cyclohydrolase FolD [Pseudobdellovibrionaceae bacterium]|tara:strand:- start:118580 stop:119428 length:849 start_codon:yes stop_codon:yes gene_type:complete
MPIIDGKSVAEKVKQQIADQVAEFAKEKGRPPCLGVILVGEDPASQVYVRNKHRTCERVGMTSKQVVLPESTSREELKEAVMAMNNDLTVDGYLVQLPLPKHLDGEEVKSWVDPKKDADGLTPENLGLLVAGTPRVVSCTPLGVMELIKDVGYDLTGKKAVVVGRSQIVGTPMSLLLTQANATVTVCHSKTVDLEAHTKEADVVVVAAGRPQMLGKSAFKTGALVIDVGIHRTEQGLCGDVKFDEVKDHVGFITPVPGGVGPMTIAMLLQNTLRLAVIGVEK